MKKKASDVLFEYSSAGDRLFNDVKHENNKKNDIFMGNGIKIDIKNTDVAPYSCGMDLLRSCLKKTIIDLFLNHDPGCDEAMLKEALMSPGYYKSTPRGVFIRLAQPKEKAFQDVFERCVFLLNRRAIASYDGRRVHFSLETP